MNFIDNKCAECVRFFKRREMDEGGGASWVFVPDSDLTYEENYWVCAACTRNGKVAMPRQCVSLVYCCGMA